MKNGKARQLLARKPTHAELNAALHQSLLAGGGTKYGRRNATVVQLATEQNPKTDSAWSGWMHAQVVSNERGVVTFKVADKFIKVNYAHIASRVCHQYQPV